MKMKSAFPIALLCIAGLVSGGCKTKKVGPATPEGLSAATFVGSWVASTVDVSIRSKNTTGPDERIHFESTELAADQGRKPTLTHFAGDGSYREEVYNLHDSLVQSKAGFWHFYADTLFMRLDVDGSPKIAFKSALSGKGLRLLSAIDWDGDGAKDDEMAVALKRP
jgi:hypothetical protein